MRKYIFPKKKKKTCKGKNSIAEFPFITTAPSLQFNSAFGIAFPEVKPISVAAVAGTLQPP